jgi:hypothetical protein
VRFVLIAYLSAPPVQYFFIPNNGLQTALKSGTIISVRRVIVDIIMQSKI